MKASEEIDTAKESLITPERLAKGDLEVAINGRGMIVRAIPIRLTIVKDLIKSRKFPNHFEIYGIGFLEMKAAYLAPFRARSSVAYLDKAALEQLGINTTPTETVELYRYVNRAMGVAKTNVIQWIVETEERRNPKNNKQFLKERRTDQVENYKICFEKLVNVMDEGSDWIRGSIESYVK